jgi:hypothetical protein
MHGSHFDELSFFAAIEASGARTLLFGRRALVLLGLPVLTADYDFWLHFDDVELLNGAVEPFELVATVDAAEARRRGRYVLQNDEHVDVLIARTVPTVDGEIVAFDDLWGRRAELWLDDHVRVMIPTLADLRRTKRFAAREKDLADLRMLDVLIAEREP